MNEELDYTQDYTEYTESRGLRAARECAEIKELLPADPALAQYLSDQAVGEIVGMENILPPALNNLGQDEVIVDPAYIAIQLGFIKDGDFDETRLEALETFIASQGLETMVMDFGNGEDIMYYDCAELRSAVTAFFTK